MGPDEYHCDVIDSVYCNVVAQFSLTTAYELAPVVGVAANTTFKTIADQLRILYDPAHQYHPEFQGYTRGTKIKQADTILLGYPLLFGTNSSTAAEVRKNDLDYYQTVTDQNGPAMYVYASTSTRWSRASLFFSLLVAFPFLPFFKYYLVPLLFPLFTLV